MFVVLFSLLLLFIISNALSYILFHNQSQILLFNCWGSRNSLIPNKGSSDEMPWENKRQSPLSSPGCSSTALHSQPGSFWSIQLWGDTLNAPLIWSSTANLWGLLLPASHLVQSFVVSSLDAHTLEKQNREYFALLILHCRPAAAWGKTGSEFLWKFYLYAVVFCFFFFSLKVEYRSIGAFQTVILWAFL